MAPTISAARSVLFQWEKKNVLKREKKVWNSDQGGAVQVLKHTGGGASILLLFCLLNSSRVPAGPRLYVWAPFKCSVSHRNPCFGQQLQALFSCSPQRALWMSFPPFTSCNWSLREKRLASFFSRRPMSFSAVMLTSEQPPIVVSPELSPLVLV